MWSRRIASLSGAARTVVDVTLVASAADAATRMSHRVDDDRRANMVVLRAVYTDETGRATGKYSSHGRHFIAERLSNHAADRLNSPWLSVPAIAGI